MYSVIQIEFHLRKEKSHILVDRKMQLNLGTQGKILKLKLDHLGCSDYGITFAIVS